MELGAAEGEEVPTDRSTQTRARFRKARWTLRVRRASSSASSASSLVCLVARRRVVFDVLTDASSEFAFDAPATTGLDRRGRLAADEATILATDEATIAPIGPELKPGPMSPASNPLPNPRGFVSDVSDAEFDKTDASDWETEEQFSRADAQLEAAYDTDAGRVRDRSGDVRERRSRAFHTRRAFWPAAAPRRVWRRRVNARRWRRVSPRRIRTESRRVHRQARFAQLQAEAERTDISSLAQARSGGRRRGAGIGGTALVARDAELDSRGDDTNATCRARTRDERFKTTRRRGRARGRSSGVGGGERGTRRGASEHGTFQTLGVALARSSRSPCGCISDRESARTARAGYRNGSSVGFMPRV